MIFALQFKNHKAGILSGCRKQTSRMSTAAAVNQLLLTICCPALRWAFPRPQMANKTAGESVGSRTASQLAVTWVQFMAQSPFWGPGKIFLTNLIVTLGLFSSCSHVELWAIDCGVEMEMGLGTTVDKLPVEASSPPRAPRVAHLGTGQS